MTQNAVLDPDLSTLQSCTPKVYKNVEVPQWHLAPTAICTLHVPKMTFRYFTFLYTLVYNPPLKSLLKCTRSSIIWKYYLICRNLVRSPEVPDWVIKFVYMAMRHGPKFRNPLLSNSYYKVASTAVHRVSRRAVGISQTHRVVLKSH